MFGSQENIGKFSSCHWCTSWHIDLAFTVLTGLTLMHFWASESLCPVT